MSLDLHEPVENAADLYVTYRANRTEAGSNERECELLLDGLRRTYTVFSPATVAPQVHSEAPDIAATRNLRALLRSRTIVYCQFSVEGRSASGLVEVGLALGLRKSAILLLADLEWAPFLLHGLSTARNAPTDASDVRIYRCKSAEEALGLFENSGIDLVSR